MAKIVHVSTALRKKHAKYLGTQMAKLLEVLSLSLESECCDTISKNIPNNTFHIGSLISRIYFVCYFT